MRVGSGNFWQFARRVLDAAGSATDAASARSALGLGTLATLSSVATGNIDADAVTYAKIQNVSASPRLMGRFTAAAGDMEEGIIGAGLSLSGSTLRTSFGAQLVHVQEQQVAGTDGGGLASGSFVTRVLNTTLTNELGAVIATNQVQGLLAGTYYAEWSTPAFAVDDFISKLRNVTDSTDILIGQVARAGSNNQSFSLGFGRFTLAATKAVSVQARVTTTNATDGGGRGPSFGVVNTFTDLRIWRIS